MYAVASLEGESLDLFRREHPWLEFPVEICEVGIYLDDNGGPTRLTAVAIDGAGQTRPFDTRTLSLDAVLALIRSAPHGKTRIEDCPEEDVVRALLERLPIADGTRPLEDVERERRSLLEQAYDLLRIIAVNKFSQALEQTESDSQRQRIIRTIAAIPTDLSSVTEATKGLFLEVDLWRLVAVVRDEFKLPIDYDLSIGPGADAQVERTLTAIELATLTDPLIQALFDLTPTALSISTTGQQNSRYIRVNQAYLDLVGKTWDEIRGHEMVSSGIVIDDNGGRAARLALLDSRGGYSGQIAHIHNGAGDLITVSISARRLFLQGQYYDFEVLTAVEG